MARIGLQKPTDEKSELKKLIERIEKLEEFAEAVAKAMKKIEAAVETEVMPEGTFYGEAFED